MRERYAGNDNGSRCLKLLLTDGGCCALAPHDAPRLHPFGLLTCLAPFERPFLFMSACVCGASAGVQQVAAAEYRHTPALHSTMAAGTKLIVQNAAVRRGILLLTPQCCAVLGGEVARLEEARQRMVTHWAQPAGERLPRCWTPASDCLEVLERIPLERTRSAA